MTESIPVANLACNTCKHWHAKPRNLADLSQPQVGECRAIPPQIIPMQQRGGIGGVAFYPVLQADTPACGLHKVDPTVSLSAN